MMGLEIELFTLNTEGKLINGASEILKAVEGTRISKYVKKELSKGMIELVAKENRSIKDCAGAFMENLQDLVEIAEKAGYRLLPLGAHPGREIPKLHTTSWYDAKKAVLGKDTVKEGRICGFHFHYTLPEGIVGKRTEMIKSLGRSHARDIFLQQYNFLVAIDPAALAFCQSSPFWMGRHWAKDCRVLIYRDLKVAKGAESIAGIHYYLPMFGAIPNYEFTLQDIRVMADAKKSQWLRLLEEKNYPTNEIAGYPTLKFMWGPMRVNKIGTFEYRGLDMNHPDVIFSVSSLLTFALRAIEKNGLEVLPSDIGIDEPFVLEDETIYVPPHSTLKYLELQSVVRGFDSESLHKYCSNLIALVEKISSSGKSRNLKLIKKMIDEKKSVSDEILDMVKKNGYSLDEDVPEDMMNHAALYQANRFASDLGAMEKAFKGFRP
jgi:hypothetical protein